MRAKILNELRIDGEIANIIKNPDKCFFLECNKPTSALDDALQKLLAGNVAFNNPERMQVGRPRIIEAKLSTNLSPAELKAQLTEAGRKEDAKIQVGDRMSATLNGGAAFDISPSGPQIQWTSQNQITTWTWNVTPKLSGVQYLILAFDAIITVEGKDGSRNVNTLKHQIEVEVGWPQTFTEWFDLSKKWFENLSWLWASILVPFGLVLLGWWRHGGRRRKRNVIDAARKKRLVVADEFLLFVDELAYHFHQTT